MARLLRPRRGIVYLDGKGISQYGTLEVARRLAILPQSHTSPAGLTVRELVEQGRYPHSGPLRMLTRQDHAAIERALSLTHMVALADRPVDTLSGGERQRAWIALTLAQDTPVLLLDEPTTYLDIGYQMEIMELIASLNSQHNITIVVVLHDLNQAARFARRMVVLNQGHIVADGAPVDILTPEIMARHFRINAAIYHDDVTNTPVFIPYQSVKSGDNGSS
jgi:iron complex transport system ATP-binding protein